MLLMEGVFTNSADANFLELDVPKFSLLCVISGQSVIPT